MHYSDNSALCLVGTRAGKRIPTRQRSWVDAMGRHPTHSIITATTATPPKK